MESVDLRLEAFSGQHFAEYASWYAVDSKLKTFLGGVDEEWLEWVTSQDDQEEFAVFIGDSMVAEVGICLPKPGDPTYVITNIAVHPSRRGTGIGQTLLDRLRTHYSLTEGQYWLAYVEEDNTNALRFFQLAGWHAGSKEEKGMIPFVFAPGS